MELFKHPQGTVGHYNLILSNLGNRFEERLIADVTGDPGPSPRRSSFSSVETHRHPQDVRELVGLGLAEAVPCVSHKHHRHHELPPRVNQLLEGLPGCRDRHSSPHQHAVNVKQEAEARLRLRLRREMWTSAAGNNKPGGSFHRTVEG